MSDNLRILCTRGSGFIGIHLVDAAIASGYDILNLDIFPPKDGRHIQRWNYCDILDDKDLKKQMLEFPQPTLFTLLLVPQCKDVRWEISK